MECLVSKFINKAIGRPDLQIGYFVIGKVERFKFLLLINLGHKLEIFHFFQTMVC